jgi:hypothetical protein
MKARTSRLALAALAASLGLAACGGGGGAAPSIPTGSATSPSQPTPQQNTAKGAISITIPSASSLSSRVNRKFISPSTKSATISLVTSGSTSQLAEADLTPSSNGCSSTSVGTKCTISFVAPPGSDTFLMKLYDQTGGKGNLLGSASVSASLSASAITSVPVVLDGTPTAASVVLGASSLPVGTAGSVSLFVQATDADGNIIVGPGSFTSPIALAITGDSNATLSLSTSTVSAPGQAITLNYNGGSLVGATITPSGSGLTGTAATFAASGVSIADYQYFDNQITNTQYWYPYDTAASSNGTIAATMYGEVYNGSSYTYPTGIVVMKNGAMQLFMGDTTDPFNVPASGSVTYPGATIVHGMDTQNITEDSFSAYDDLAMNANGNIYYGTSFSSTSDTACSGTIHSGTLGVFNPTAGTATEYVLKGVPGPIKVDSSGNAWFMEYNGSCNGADLLGSDSYAIGELKAGASAPTETPLSAVGLSSFTNVSDMAITPDGSQMFIADGGQHVAKIATATLASPAIIQLTNSTDPYAIAAGPDGSALWFSDNDPAYNYYYGYVSGSKSFAQANLVETLFPVQYFFAYSAAYADGSFWAGGDYERTGIGRISGVSSGTVTTSDYQLVNGDNDTQEICGIGAGGGYVVAGDCDYGNLDVVQYGAPTTSGNYVANVKRMTSITSRKRQGQPNGVTLAAKRKAALHQR